MAATTSLMKHSVLLLLMLSWATTAVQAVALTGWYVHVVNGLSGRQNLLVHCKSKDDDLGVHNLGVGKEFKWSFFVNFWNTTLFWCYLRKPNGEAVAFESFWVEKRSIWLYYKCYVRNCIWIGKDDGVYLRNNLDARDVLVHKWISHPND